MQEKAKSKYENENLDDFLKKLTSLLRLNSKNSIFFSGKKVLYIYYNIYYKNSIFFSGKKVLYIYYNLILICLSFVFDVLLNVYS